MISFPKLKVTPKLVRLAYHFFDVEASAETAVPDSRMIEYAFIIGKLSLLPKGKVLDVGCTARLNYLPVALASLGWEVWGIDLREFKFKHPNFHFVEGDIRKTGFPDNSFHAVYALSTLEYIGLSGRYGVNRLDPEGGCACPQRNNQSPSSRRNSTLHPALRGGKNHQAPSEDI